MDVTRASRAELLKKGLKSFKSGHASETRGGVFEEHEGDGFAAKTVYLSFLEEANHPPGIKKST